MHTEFRDLHLSTMEKSITYPFYSPLLTDFYRFDEFCVFYEGLDVTPNKTDDTI